MNSFFKSRFEEISFIGIILFAFIAFYVETDIYTPTFPQMMLYFHTSEDMIQMLLSMNFLGLCASSIILGPASDAFGRKRILCSGLFIFMVGSIGCAFTDSLYSMIFLRFFQGIGCGAIASAGATLIFDIYPPTQSSQLVSVTNGVVAGVMALAPVIGNWIGIQMGWRANFYVIAILATLSCLLIWAFIKETLPIEKRIRLNVSEVMKNYYSIFINFPFMAYTLIWCIGFSIIIVFIANLSLVFIEYLQVPKEVFGYYQTGIMGAFFIGSVGGAYLNKLTSMRFTNAFGSICYLFGVLFLAVFTFAKITSPILLILAMLITSLGAAVSSPIYFTYAMNYLDERLKGSAMAFTQSLRLLITSVLVWIAANNFNGTTQPMACLALACAGICVLLYAVLYKRRATELTS